MELLAAAGALLDYAIVDVFALTAPAPDGSPQVRPYTGNPLAVVLGAERLTTAQCQALAREFNLSETAFVLPSGVADYRARIFTPAGELPFAGHPSIGTAWTLAALGTIPPGSRVQECGAGLVELEIPAAGAPGDGVRLTGPLPSAMRPAPAPGLLAVLGLTGDDLAQPAPQAVPLAGGSGIAFAFLPVREGALARCRPNAAALAALDAGGTSVTGVLVFELAGDPATGPLQVNARMFAAGELTTGLTEDPATGSAALGFGGWLAAAGLTGEGTRAYAITQGVDMGRPSLLLGDVTVSGGAVSRVRVSGHVAAVATGRIRVP